LREGAFSWSPQSGVVLVDLLAVLRLFAVVVARENHRSVPSGVVMNLDVHAVLVVLHRVVRPVDLDAVGGDERAVEMTKSPSPRPTRAS
jgi:hypothetical protein